MSEEISRCRDFCEDLIALLAPTTPLARIRVALAAGKGPATIRVK